MPLECKWLDHNGASGRALDFNKISGGLVHGLIPFSVCPYRRSI